MNTNHAPARRNVDNLLEQVERSQLQLAAYLPDNVKLENFMALARRAITEQPELAQCSSVSVLRALSRCASSGLPLDGQFSSLIIRKSKNGPPTATWDPSYRGMITLALSSGFVTDVQSFVVKAEDEFRVEQGTEPKIHHIPALLRGGRVVAAYAWARLRSGQLVVEVLGADDIAAIKAKSPAGDKGPWGSWADQMARKSATRRLLKKLPAGPARILEWDDYPAAVSRETPAANHQARIAPPAALPEHENMLECGALERLRNAADDAGLNAAWQQTVLEYQQAGVRIPQAVITAYNELADPPADDREPGPHDEWLDDYDRG
jgi:phage RecT family recombinase